jgi:putative tricarboxylic transport membrane protein
VHPLANVRDALAALLLLFGCAAAAAQAWRPEKAVEIVTSSAAGGSNDQVARVMQRILQDRQIAPVPIVVANKPGGNQTLAVAYLSQSAGNGHALLLANPTLFGNHIAGVTPLYPELTLVSTLLLEHIVFSVRADSGIRTTRELFERLKADPSSLSIGTVARGGILHLTLSVAARAAGVDPRRLKLVVFKTNAESMTALTGGHIDMVVSSLSSASGQVKAGAARIVGVSSAKRLGAELADVPTLAEQGMDTGLASWRAVYAPRGVTPAQVTYWHDTLSRMAATEEWKKTLETQQWASHYLQRDEAARYMEANYKAMRTIMAELGLVR